jgi:hypothetical protein
MMTMKEEYSDTHERKDVNEYNLVWGAPILLLALETSAEVNAAYINSLAMRGLGIINISSLLRRLQTKFKTGV